MATMAWVRKPLAKGSKSVKTDNLSFFDQYTVLRFRNRFRRKKAATCALEFTKNNNIKYDHIGRLSLYNECERINWDYKRIREIRKCGCDGAMLIVCVINMVYRRKVIPAYATCLFLAEFSWEYNKTMFKVFNVCEINYKEYDKIGDIHIESEQYASIIVE